MTAAGALLPALLGCAGPTVDSGEPTPADPAVASPDLDPTEVAAVLERALAAGIPEPWTPRDLFLELLSQGDSACPGEPDMLARPEYSCTSDGGYDYYGVGLYLDESDDDHEGWQMAIASFRITSPDGSVFEAGGTWGYTGGAEWTGYIDATTGRHPDDGWLGDAPSTALDLSGSRDARGSTLVLTGGLNSQGNTVWFDGTTTDDIDCAGALAGTVQVRSPAGTWYDLRFGDTCGTCAEVWLDDQELGEACVEVAASVRALLATLEAR